MSNSLPMELTLPKGVKDFLPHKAAKIEYLQQTLQRIFRLWGYRPVCPPMLEYLHVLERGLGESLKERTFRFDDRQNGHLIAFTPDITPQVARIVASRMHAQPLPQRLAYQGRVLRHTEQQAGKDRELFQAGVEHVGSYSPAADAECIALAVTCLQQLNLEGFTIDIGQVDFFQGVMENCPIDAQSYRQLQQAMQRKDNAALQQLVASLNLPSATATELLALPRLFGTGEQVLAQAEKTITSPRARHALENLQELLELLEQYQVADHITVDLGELRNPGYHTGITFQGFLAGIGNAICLGGRYDNLLERYGYPAAATGFTFNLTELLFALDKELDQEVSDRTDFLLAVPPQELAAGQHIAQQLRQQGHTCILEQTAASPDEVLNYTTRLPCRFLAQMTSPDQPWEITNCRDGKRHYCTSGELAQLAFFEET